MMFSRIEVDAFLMAGAQVFRGSDAWMVLKQSASARPGSCRSRSLPYIHHVAQASFRRSKSILPSSVRISREAQELLFFVFGNIVGVQVKRFQLHRVGHVIFLLRRRHHTPVQLVLPLGRRSDLPAFSIHSCVPSFIQRDPFVATSVANTPLRWTADANSTGVRTTISSGKDAQ